MMNSDRLEDKEALMIQDMNGDTVISFLHIPDEPMACMAIVTFDGIVFMLQRDQVIALKKKVEDILSKDLAQ